MTKTEQSERAEYIGKLRETLKPGDKLYTVLRSVSRSGMSRVIDVYRFGVSNQGTVEKSWLSYWVAKACGFTFQDRRGLPEGIKIGGCGMDMGFNIVYTVGRVLWPDGFGVKCQHCDYRPESKESAECRNEGLTALRLVSRDIGYGVDKRTIQGRFTGEVMADGMRAFQLVHQAIDGAHSPLWLFPDEIKSEHTVTGHEFYGRNGDKSGWDNNGGYALDHEWI